MRRCLGLAVAALCAGFVWPAPVCARTQQADSAFGLRRRTLENGLQVIVLQNSTVPLATALVAVHSGAFTQDTNEAGLAHLYEHLLFHTFRHNPSAFGIEATKLKGAYNGTTSQEVVNYFVMVPSDKIEPAIGLLADLMQKADFSNNALKAERHVVLDEIQRIQSDPEGELQRRVDRALWGTAWHRKDIGGDSASLENISLDLLKATYARYYVPNNAALIVTGDVDPDRVFDVALHKFGGWKPAPNPFADRPVPQMPPLAGTAAVVVGQDVVDVTITIALHGPSVSADPGATYAADVLLDIFNDPTSAFQRRLVGSGPFESVTGEYVTLDHTGPIQFQGKTTPAHAQQAILALVSELQNLDLLQGVTEDDLAIARKRRQVGGALARERTAALAPGLATWWSIAGMDYYLGYHDHVENQTADSLRRFASIYVTAAPKVIGVLANPYLAHELSEWVRKGAPPPPSPAGVKP